MANADGRESEIPLSMNFALRVSQTHFILSL